MVDIVILGVIVILVVLALRPTIKHMKGKGSCCGGGSTPAHVPEKKLENVIGIKQVVIDGMTCEHCKSWVEKSINEIDGASAKVNLKKKTAMVSVDREISDDEIRAAVEKAGYKVVSIK